jgi:hypothetical protein
VFCMDLNQTIIISMYSIKFPVFITEMESVYCAVRPESLYVIKFNRSFKMFRRSVNNVVTQLNRMFLEKLTNNSSSSQGHLAIL